MKRLLGHMIPLPRTLADFEGLFVGSIHPFKADFNVLWGLVELNVKVLSVANLACPGC